MRGETTDVNEMTIPSALFFGHSNLWHLKKTYVNVGTKQQPFTKHKW